MKQINEYRCTRQRYGKPEECEGHYIRAEHFRQALARMAEKFPEDVAEGYGFECELWKTNVPTYENVGG